MTSTWEEYYRRLGLSDPAIEELRTFLAVAGELEARRFFRTQSRLEVYVEADRGRVDGVSDHGDAEDLRSALMSLRKILSDKEPGFVNRVVSHLIRVENNAGRNEQVQKSYQEIKNARRKLAEGVRTLNSDGSFSLRRGRTCESALRDLFNTQLFHEDQRPVPPLPETRGVDLPDSDPIMMLLRQNILELVFDEYQFALWLRDFIRSNISEG